MYTDLGGERLAELIAAYDVGALVSACIGAAALRREWRARQAGALPLAA